MPAKSVADARFYDTLGVDPHAAPEDIRRAYRKLALLHHPDRNRGDQDAAARFREVAAAYSVLSDPERRAAYDQHGDLSMDGVDGEDDSEEGHGISEKFADFSHWVKVGACEPLTTRDGTSFERHGIARAVNFATSAPPG